MDVQMRNASRDGQLERPRERAVERGVQKGGYESQWAQVGDETRTCPLYMSTSPPAFTGNDGERVTVHSPECGGKARLHSIPTRAQPFWKVVAKLPP